MNHQTTASDQPRQPETSHLVTGDYASLTRWLNTCPSAGTLVAWSMTLHCSVLLKTRCKRWACPHCGPRRIAHLTKKIANARPNKFVTLTLRTTNYETPREAYDHSRRMVSRLVQKIRREVGQWEYLRVLEVTRKGFPHYHLIVRGNYVDQRWLTDQWDKLTGSWIVDIKQVRTREHTIRYITKYLYKQKSIPWTNRRVSWSKHFFLPDDTPKPQPLNLEEVYISGTDPVHYCFHELQGRTLVAIGPDAYEIH